MTWGYERGRVYNRRADVHGRFGGQQQGGIITPARHSVIFTITGEEGLQHGYGDRQLPDGVFEYFGEGQVGDMPWVRGNSAIRDHVADGKDLLLFRKTAGGLRFEAEMICQGWRYETAPDSDGTSRRAIVFELRDLESVSESTDVQPASVSDFDELRRRAFSAATASVATGSATRTVYQRSADVRDYVLARAAGACEGCGQPAPFVRPDGRPYLEPHHIRRLSDGGPDDPRFVIALCPTCHRRVHHGSDGAGYNAKLLVDMVGIQPTSGRK